MVFTDLAREELVAAVRHADDRRSATEVFLPRPEAASAPRKQADRTWEFLERVRPPTGNGDAGQPSPRHRPRPLPPVAAGTGGAAGNNSSEGRSTMDDETRADDEVHPLRPVPYVCTPGTASPEPEAWRNGRLGGAALPGLNDSYKAAGTPDNNEVSRLVPVMGKDGFKPGGTA